MGMAGELGSGGAGIVTTVPIPADCPTMLGMPAPRPGPATRTPRIITPGAPDASNGGTSTELQLLQPTTEYMANERLS